jgi:glycosyltransferase involved in cell wall biosynthesis
LSLPCITIITVVYNGAASIESTIQSVLKLDYPDIEFIIIDGNSKDGTQEVIRKYQHRLSYWTSEPDKGIYDAMNKGWAKARNDSYMLFLGAGDTIIQLPDMSRHSNDDVIFGRVHIGNKYIFDSTADLRSKLVNAFHHQALLIKKSVHPGPPFSLEYPLFADFDFNQRLLKSGVRFVKDPDFIAYAMEGGVSAVIDKKEHYAIVRKNYGSFYVVLTRLYFFLQNIKYKVTGLNR